MSNYIQNRIMNLEEVNHVLQESRTITPTYNNDLTKFIITVTSVAALNICEPDISRYIKTELEHVDYGRLIDDYAKEVTGPLYEASSFYQHAEFDKINQTKDLITKQIISFKFLNYNWDGYGAIPAEAESTANAVKIINGIQQNLFPKLEEYFSNPNGTISLIWGNIDSECVSMEVGNRTFSYYVKYNNVDPLFFNKVALDEKEFDKVSDFISAI